MENENKRTFRMRELDPFAAAERHVELIKIQHEQGGSFIDAMANKIAQESGIDTTQHKITTSWTIIDIDNEGK